MDRRAATGLLLAAAAYASWGLLSPVGKHLLGSFEPMGLNAVRFGLACVAILPWLGVRGIKDSLRTLGNRHVLWANVLANGSLTLFAYSLVHLEPTFSTLGFYTAPLWTAILAHARLGERVGPWFAPAALGLLAGGYVTLFGFAAPGPGFAAGGMTLAVGSGVAWAFYAVHLRRHAAHLELKPLMGASFLAGALWFTVLALVLEGPPALLHQDAAAWGWIGINVLFPTLVAFILFNAALQRAPASQVNILIALELAFTVVFAAILFDDRFTGGQLAGLALALASVSAYLWVQDRSNRATPAPVTPPS